MPADSGAGDEQPKRTFLSFPDNWDDLTPAERGQGTLEMADIFIAQLVGTPNSPDDTDKQPPEPPEGP